MGNNKSKFNTKICFCGPLRLFIRLIIRVTKSVCKMICLIGYKNLSIFNVEFEFFQIDPIGLDIVVFDT